MWELARRNLLRERTRLAISVAGVALAVVLMLSLVGVYNGYRQRVADYFGGIGADLWVVQTGTSNFFHSASLLPAEAEEQMAALPGVASVRPYVWRQVAFEAKGRQLLTMVVGVDPGERVGGAARLVEGSASPGPAEIVVDRALADAGGLEVGDTLSLRGRSLRIVALTTGTDMVMYQYSFAPLADVLQVQGTSSVVNFFLLRLEPGVDPSTVAAAVRSTLADAEAWTPEKVIAENQGVIEDAFLPVIGVILLIGSVVGAAVIGLTTYSAVLEKRREYGVLKALGASFGATCRVVLAQSGIAGIAGYVVGVLGALGLARFLPGVVPEFSVDIEPAHAGLLLLAVVGMVLVSVVPPLRRLSRIDPAEVFRS